MECIGAMYRTDVVRRDCSRAAAGGGQRAPARAASRWLARETPEVVAPHGLKSRAAPQSLSVPPTCGCPLLWDLLWGRHGSDRTLRGGKFREADVS